MCRKRFETIFVFNVDKDQRITTASDLTVILIKQSYEKKHIRFHNNNITRTTELTQEQCNKVEWLV